MDALDAVDMVTAELTGQELKGFEEELEGLLKKYIKQNPGEFEFEAAQQFLVNGLEEQ